MHFCMKKDPPTGRSLGRIAFPGRTATVTAISQCRGGRKHIGGGYLVCGKRKIPFPGWLPSRRRVPGHGAAFWGAMWEKLPIF